MAVTTAPERNLRMDAVEGVDGDLALGRVVAKYDIEREKRGGLNAWRTAAVSRKQ